MFVGAIGANTGRAGFFSLINVITRSYKLKVKCSKKCCLKHCTGLRLVLVRTPTNFLHTKALVISRRKRVFSKVIEYKFVAQKKLINGELVK